MSTLNAIRDTFFEECEDLLEAMVEGLTAIDSGTWDKETVNAVFRVVHSIKGGAGAFGLDDPVGFAHTFETVFDDIRSDRLAVTANLVQVFFRASDMLVILVEASRDGTDFDTARRDTSLAELKDALGDDGAEEKAVPEFHAMTLDFGAIPHELAEQEDEFVVRFVPARAMFANGHEPARIFKHLEGIGRVEVELDASELPVLDEVEIEIADDGAGLNRPKNLQIAKDKGLVPPDAEMSDAEIAALLFMAGFSTAQEVSDLSRRGVGMGVGTDVVKTLIRGLGGRVSIASGNRARPDADRRVAADPGGDGRDGRFRRLPDPGGNRRGGAMRAGARRDPRPAPGGHQVDRGQLPLDPRHFDGNDSGRRKDRPDPRPRERGTGQRRPWPDAPLSADAISGSMTCQTTIRRRQAPRTWNS